MDDPTKDTIPRSAVEYCLRKETVSTNPEKYKTHEKFIDYMNDPDISEFGHWMHSNGFNCALTAISVDLKKIPSVTPSSQPPKETPKRVLWSGWKGYRDTRYKCPNCEKPVRNDDTYCHRCGQRLMFPHISFTDYVPGEKQDVIVRWEDESE